MAETETGTSEETTRRTWSGTTSTNESLLPLQIQDSAPNTGSTDAESSLTHPWLNFQLDLRSAPYPFWLALGEARSKIAHIASVPIHPDFAARLYELFLAKGAQATTAIEGNTLSEEQVLEQIKGKLKLPPSQEYLQQEVANIIDALHRVSADALSGASDRLTEDRVAEYNRLVLRDLPLNDEDIVPGEYRRDRRVVGSYRCPPPKDCQQLLARFCLWMNGKDFAPNGPLDAVSTAIIKAIVAHLYFVWIHPFGDGNGRTARLVEFQILLEAGIAQPAAHLLSNHYNQTRTEYYRQLAAASGKGGDVTTFLTYAVQGYVDQLKQQIEWITTQQMHVAWENYVYDHFRDDLTPTRRRRRTVVLALTRQEQPVPPRRIPRLTPELTRMYDGKTPKTVARDLNALVYEDRLLYRAAGGYAVNRQAVVGLRAPRRDMDRGSRNP